MWQFQHSRIMAWVRFSSISFLAPSVFSTSSQRSGTWLLSLQRRQDSRPQAGFLQTSTLSASFSITVA